MLEEILVMENLHNWRIICLQTVVGRERSVCNAMVLSTMFDLDRINHPGSFNSAAKLAYMLWDMLWWWDLFLLIQCCVQIFVCSHFLMLVFPISWWEEGGGSGSWPAPKPTAEWRLGWCASLCPCFLGFNLDLTIISKLWKGREYYTIINIVCLCV